MGNALKIIGIGAVILVFLVVGSLVYIGMVAPDTAIYTGKQIPKRFLKTIESLDLLDDGETIKYFYSDALLDIKDGMYFVTDRNVVIYCEAWSDPRAIIPLDEIEDLDAAYDDSFIIDSTVFLTFDGEEYSFPISSEKGLDKKFVRAIEKGMEQDTDRSRRGRD